MLPLNCNMTRFTCVLVLLTLGLPFLSSATGYRQVLVTIVGERGVVCELPEKLCFRWCARDTVCDFYRRVVCYRWHARDDWHLYIKIIPRDQNALFSVSPTERPVYLAWCTHLALSLIGALPPDHRVLFARLPLWWRVVLFDLCSSSPPTPCVRETAALLTNRSLRALSPSQVRLW